MRAGQGSHCLQGHYVMHGEKNSEGNSVYNCTKIRRCHMPLNCSYAKVVEMVKFMLHFFHHDL